MDRLARFYVITLCCIGFAVGFGTGTVIWSLKLSSMRTELKLKTKEATELEATLVALVKDEIDQLRKATKTKPIPPDVSLPNVPEMQLPEKRDD